MKDIQKRGLLCLLCAVVLFSSLCVTPVGAEGEEIDFLSYEEAVNYYDFSRAAANWCNAVGWNATRMDDAKAAILAGTNPELIIRLATYTRDLGYGFEPLQVTNAFRPASYQETIGLHDANTNIGPFRNALLWNGRNVKSFWWTAEQAPGWPEEYTVDLSGYDLSAMNLRYLYRFGLRLWDNTWAGGYYARPGCSGHNSGCAMDISNWWIAANFNTTYTSTVNGKTLSMADYGIYKPMQPSATSAGEEWHITCETSAVGMENYDGAFALGYEPAWGTYFNPVDRGWTMADGRGVYIGAGVLCLQVRLCQLGLLEEKYITGFFCHTTTEAVKAYQAKMELESDGICGPATMAMLMERDVPADTAAPEMGTVTVGENKKGGFTLLLTAKDDQCVDGYRLDIRPVGTERWDTRYYNALSDGSGEILADAVREGEYEFSVRAVDAAGNESENAAEGRAFADLSGPVLRRITVSDITKDGFSLTCVGDDVSGIASYTLRLTPEEGEPTELTLAPDDSSPWRISSPGEGSYTLTLIAEDTPGYTSEHTLRWKYEPAGAEQYRGLSITGYAPI